MTFKDPWILILLPIVLVIFFYTRKNFIKSGFVFPSDEALKDFKGSLKLMAIRNMVYVRCACIVLVMLALARPMVREAADIRKEGIGIVIAMDVSSTMLAEDMNLTMTEQLSLVGQGLRKADEEKARAKRKNRIDVSREVARDFIKSRPDDLIGIVVFGADAFVVCPMTLDHEWAITSLDRVRGGVVKDGTAIGSGILSSLNQLKGAKAKSRIILLQTDGINNFGNVSPMIAAKAARSLGVKIYTIGIVSGRQVPYPVQDARGNVTYKSVRIDINEEQLQKIAELTGGKYFRATDMKSLQEDYKEIDKLEKTGIEEKRLEDYRDIFPAFAIAALVLLLLEVVLSNTILRKIP